MSTPSKPSVPDDVWAAVYAVIRALPADAASNARVWRSVYTALDAAGFDIPREFISDARPPADIERAELRESRFRWAEEAARLEAEYVPHPKITESHIIPEIHITFRESGSEDWEEVAPGISVQKDELGRLACIEVETWKHAAARRSSTEDEEGT